MYKKLLTRLPDNYNKDENSNISKLYQIFATELALIEKTLVDVEDSKDVDKSLGGNLDLIGKNVLEYRADNDDEKYRQWIKIKILANRSVGNIPIINHILSTYMGDDFISIEDGWNSYVNEPASMVVNIASSAKEIPFKVLDRIRAAGVRVYFTAGSETTNIIIDFRSYDFEVPYKICNMFRTDDKMGILGKALIELFGKYYEFPTEYPICNAFVASDEDSATFRNNIVLSAEYRDNDILYKRVGSTTIGEGDI